MKDFRNIFIFDDDKTHRMMLNVVFNSWGYTAFAAGSEVDVLKTILDRRVDLIIMDIDAVRQSDMEDLMRIMAAEPLKPVIFMTSYSPKNQIAELKKTGALEVLVKPIKLEDLETIFRTASEK